MDFPIFHLDFIGNRLLIAIIAVLHVFINHPLAVGAMPLITLLEWWGHRKRDLEWDRLAYRALLVCFVITTSVGALTGVGIWFSTSLVNPAAIGSLIRVFFWAWFIEWIVFVIEVVLIMLYFLTWKRMQDRKGLHIALGVGLSVFSWITMAIITAILGFMMEPGRWASEESFISGVFNPIYLPQLAFRTPVAMVTAATFVLFLIYFFTRSQIQLRGRVIRLVSLWILGWLPLVAAGCLWYWKVVPAWMLENVPVALVTQDLTRWHQEAALALAALVAVMLACAVLGAARPGWLPRGALLVPFALSLVILGSFERVREFIRKPYVIGGYMYANGIRQEDYPLLQEEGLLPHAAFARVRSASDGDRLLAGQEMFRIACTRCHTSNGVNAVRRRLERMYGPSPWDRDVVKTYLGSMHLTRPFMPPVPGNDAEKGALADYLVALGQRQQPVTGAQISGFRAAHSTAAPAVGEVGGAR
jgi:mono/diheme cytochrome c family protein